MSYAYSAALTAKARLGGRWHYYVTVTEAGVTGNTDEWQITLNSLGVPPLGTVKLVSAATSGGTATTIDPQAGEAAAGVNIYENSAAAASVRFEPSSGKYAAVVAGIIYGQSKANGTATTITTRLTIVEGLHA